MSNMYLSISIRISNLLEYIHLMEKQFSSHEYEFLIQSLQKLIEYLEASSTLRELMVKLESEEDNSNA